MTRPRPVDEVTATREGDWWAIGLDLDVDEHALDVAVTPVLPGLSAQTQEAIEIRQRLAELQGRLGEVELGAVGELREQLAVRDVAELFGITPSRVSQIDRRRA